MKKQYKFKQFFLCVCVIILIVPMISFFLPFHIYSNPLAADEIAPPTVSSFFDGSYQTDANTFFNDHMIAYSPMIWLKTNIDLMLGKKDVNGVYITSNTLIEKPDLPDDDSCAQVASAINQFYEKTGKKMYSLIIPTNAQINSSLLPSYGPKADESKIINRINNSLNNSIVSLDAVTSLTPVKDNNIYYATDSRLTSLGAFSIYNYNMKSMGFTPASLQEFNIEYGVNDYYGRLYDRTFYMGVPADRVDLYHYNMKEIQASVQTITQEGQSVRSSVYDNSLLTGRNSVEALFGKPAPLKTITTNSNTGKSLVIFGDENMDPFIQFLMLHYSKITVVNLSLLNKSMSALVQNQVQTADSLLTGYSIESLSRPEMLSLLSICS